MGEWREKEVLNLKIQHQLDQQSKGQKVQCSSLLRLCAVDISSEIYESGKNVWKYSSIVVEKYLKLITFNTAFYNCWQIQSSCQSIALSTDRNYNLKPAFLATLIASQPLPLFLI